MSMRVKTLAEKVVVTVPLARADSPEVKKSIRALIEYVGGCTKTLAQGSWYSEEQGEFITEHVVEHVVWCSSDNVGMVLYYVEDLVDSLLDAGEEAVLVVHNDEAVLYSKEEEE